MSQARPAEGDPSIAPDVVPRTTRRFVVVLLFLFAVPGVIGFDAWPLTGWRLFSLARGAEISLEAPEPAWGIAAIDGDGISRIVSLEELPLGYRHAQWPMATLPEASTERRQAVCAALLDAVVEVAPGTVELHITRDDPRLVEREGTWEIIRRVDVFHRCVVATDGPRGDAARSRDARSDGARR